MYDSSWTRRNATSRRRRTFVKALKSAAAWERWRALSYTHQREHLEAIEAAKKPETRARRIDRAIQMVTAPTRRR